ncbi:MAG: hypothetical protein HC767_15760 [Akkermansiaceae bacterium]|nr:hypothetical protein [Akkermansiaceae bacterium]
MSRRLHRVSLLLIDLFANNPAAGHVVKQAARPDWRKKSQLRCQLHALHPNGIPHQIQEKQNAHGGAADKSIPIGKQAANSCTGRHGEPLHLLTKPKKLLRFLLLRFSRFGNDRLKSRICLGRLWRDAHHPLHPVSSYRELREKTI